MSDPHVKEGGGDAISGSPDLAKTELTCALFDARRLGDVEAPTLTMTQRFPAFAFG